MENKHPWVHETNGKQEIEHEHEDVVEDVVEEALEEEALEEEVIEEVAEAVEEVSEEVSEEVNEEFKDLAVGSRTVQDGQMVYWNGHSWVSRSEFHKQ